MKKLLASLLCAALVIALAPISFAQNTGQISGTATISGKPMPNTTVRVRNVDNGTIAATGKTDGQGNFSFASLPAGNYVIEIVSDDGQLIGTSAKIALVAGAMVASGISVGATAAVAGTAGAVAAGGGAFFASTAGIITMAAIGTGVAAGIIVANDASPSQ
jgi:hypothetical protein